jgi:hypothetical protein
MTVRQLREILSDPGLEDRHEVVGIFDDYENGCVDCGEPDEAHAPVAEAGIIISPNGGPRVLAIRFSGKPILVSQPYRRIIIREVQEAGGVL